MNMLKNHFNHLSHFWMNLWHHLNQPLLNPDQPAIAAPIERDSSDTVQFLERCWARDCSSEKHG